MEQEQRASDRPPVDFFNKLIGSGFYTGYAPFATGTVGSLIGLAFFFIPTFHDPFTLIPLTIILFLLGGMAAEKMEKAYGQDPKQVTVDEIVGMWMSMWFVPCTMVNLALAFLIFRVLDILKPYPAGEFDKRSGGWNIMLDDVIAAIYTNAIIQISMRINIF